MAKDIRSKVKRWASFYRSNPHRFAEDALNIHLHLFQRIILYMMNSGAYFAYIAARGQGKSFIIAVFCVIRCILFPGTKICIASGTRGQAQNIVEKIKTELVPNSEMLRLEIDRLVISATDTYVEFKNGSRIKVVTASDSARGNRCNILIVDEFRMVNKEVINTVLRKFLTSPRVPGFLKAHLNDPEYQKYKEKNKQIYLTSAYFKSHWSYQQCVDYKNQMLDDSKQYFVCGLPYQLSIHEGLLDPDMVADEMAESDFNEATFDMEMSALWFGDDGGSFFDFDSISSCRRIQYPMLPDDIVSRLSDQRMLRIQPKQPGEIRILSIDLAFMRTTSKNKNDASAIFINQMKPTKAGRYTHNYIYTESCEGKHTQDQALRSRKLFDMYECDYIAIDVRGSGLGVADALVRDIVDPETGEVYPAISCINDSDWAVRCTSPNARKVMWAISASSKLNSDAAILLRDGFRSGRVRLLISEYDAEELLHDIRGYDSLPADMKMKIKLAYINETLLISELLKLDHDESGGLVKISEKPGCRKDRYSSISYNYYVSLQIEDMVTRKETRKENYASDSEFCFRAPKIK